MQLYKPTGGEILIDGKNVEDFDKNDMR